MVYSMKRTKESVLISAMLIVMTYTLALSLVSQALPAGQASKTLSSSGSIQIQTSVGVGVYSNYQCTTPLSSVSWGTLEPGTSKQISCYIKNEGNTPITLGLETSNWNPLTAANYLNLTWNYNNQPINPTNSVAVTLTLAVSPSIAGITTFGFDISIVAE